MWTPSLCRACTNLCPVEVETRDGRLIAVRADPEDPVYQGFACARGLNQPAYYNHPERLLHSLKRGKDGSYAPIPSHVAMDEIAERLAGLKTRHGPRSIALYWGMMAVANVMTAPMTGAFMRALASPMFFSASTIDKPGRAIAQALHGSWMAPRQGYEDADVGLLVGLNPLVSFQGTPMGHPPHWYRDAIAHGMELIVIDPRRTETARRATLHLQPRPGTDAAILAAMIHVIIAERRHDAAFVAEHVVGLEALARAVQPFDPASAAEAAGLNADDIAAAARKFASGRRGFAAAGTGPSMSGTGTLVEYLVLCLETLCGHWLRPGEVVGNPGVLFPTQSAIAQAAPPRPGYGFGEKLRVRGLTDTAAGMPTGGLADEIATPGEGQVRALISCAGNPANAWPDEARALTALRSLDLLVQVDPWMSQTARLADYVIAPKMAYETPTSTIKREMAGLYGGPTISWNHPYGRCYPPAAETPPGSDLLEEWEFLLGVAHRMDLEPILIGPAGQGVVLDRATAWTTDLMHETLCRGSRIPYAEVKSSGGKTFREPPLVVRAKEPGWEGRLQVGDGAMMADLAETARALRPAEDRQSFRLLCRRTPLAYNSSFHAAAIGKGRNYNPAYLHPDDLARLGLAKGARVVLRSAYGTTAAIVEPDPNLRRGLISISHGFGEPGEDPRSHGSNINTLLDAGHAYERYSGQPQMSNIAVEVLPEAGVGR